METSAKWFLAIAGLLLLLPEHENSQRLSDLRKRRSRKLFYVSDGKVIPRSEVDTAKRMTRAGYGKVYAVWAYNADEARDYIQKGKAEVVNGLNALLFKKGDQAELVHRYGNVPIGKRGIVTKVWINPISKEQWVRLFYGKNLTGQILQQSYPFNVLKKIEKPEEKQGVKFTPKQILIPEQKSFTQPTQMTLFGIHRQRKYE